MPSPTSTSSSHLGAWLRRSLSGSALACVLLLSPVHTLFAHEHEADLAGPASAEAQPAAPVRAEAGAAEVASSGVPPLPFREPLVGPLVKRGPIDDIERRSTAFLPDPKKFAPAFEHPDDERWIRVDLGDQMVIAYEGSRPVRGFIMSSGLPRTPTVTGRFHIRMKVKAQTMVGGSGAYYYNLPNVKWVQYFYADYGFHGTYWHNNFGQPMSHGCINMTNADAKWLFDWAGPEWDGVSIWQRSTEENPGTLVVVHE